jgi:prepilin peptidase CpaA
VELSVLTRIPGRLVFPMKVQATIWAFTIGVTLLAAIVDFRTHKIPNWLTVPAFVVGLTLRTVLSGWPGAKASLEGAGLALALLLPLVLMRALGAGDWKLMGAVGAFVGPILFLFVLLGSVLVSGLMAMVEMMRTRRVKETFGNLVVLVQGFFSFGLRAHPEISLDNPGLLKLPFGVAVAIATVACFCAAHWGL